MNPKIMYGTQPDETPEPKLLTEALSPIAQIYKTKVKKPWTGPPRPTLLGHEKVLKDAKLEAEAVRSELNRLRSRMSELEEKMNRQSAYLSELHRTVVRRK